MNRIEIKKLEAGRETDRLTAEALGYDVRWWSIHPIEEATGDYRLCTFGIECLLPDKDGDMPALEMLVDREWTPVPAWSENDSLVLDLIKRFDTWSIWRVYDPELSGLYGSDFYYKIALTDFETQRWAMINAVELALGVCQAILIAALIVGEDNG